MAPVDLLTAAIVLPVVVGVGTVVHELSHVLALHGFGIPYEVEWLPDGDTRGFASLRATLATVTPTAVPSDLAPWRLRAAALMPLTLAVPIPLVLLGLIPDPIASGDPVHAAVSIGWIACALPSPQDFSLVWYPEEAIQRYQE